MARNEWLKNPMKNTMLHQTPSEKPRKNPSLTEINDHTASWPIAVFAHNEAGHIVQCLESLTDAARGHDITAYVLVNGCTDSTLGVVEEYCRGNSWARPINIQLGDKANAWNAFVHEYAPESNIYFFVDGDVRAASGSLLELDSALRNSTGINAAAAVPGSGRNRAVAVERMKQESGLAGNLYALSGEFVANIRRKGVRLPIGFIGEDGLVGALALWDLDPVGKSWDSKRVTVCTDAKFHFDSLSLWKPGDWRLYWRRRISYAVRGYQNHLLRKVLKSGGVAAMPHSAAELYRDDTGMRLRWEGMNTIFLWLALRRMRIQKNMQSS